MPFHIPTQPLYNSRPWHYLHSAWGETNYATGESTRNKKSNVMGDRSPKANQKKSTQKQSKADSADQKKKQAVFEKQSANKKK